MNLVSRYGIHKTSINLIAAVLVIISVIILRKPG